MGLRHIPQNSVLYLILNSSLLSSLAERAGAELDHWTLPWAEQDGECGDPVLLPGYQEETQPLSQESVKAETLLVSSRCSGGGVARHGPRQSKEQESIIFCHTRGGWAEAGLSRVARDMSPNSS